MRAAKRLRIFIIALLICFVCIGPTPAPAGSNWKQVIVRCSPDDLAEVKRVLGAAVVDYSSGHYLLSVSSTVDVKRAESVKSRVGVPIVVENDEPVRLRRRGSASATAANTLPKTLGPISNYYGGRAPQMYTDQYAVGQIDLKDALRKATGSGVRVAVIDTGIDFSHKVFGPGILRPGKNYVGLTNNPSEFDDPILVQNSIDWLDLSQNSIDWLDLSQNSLDWIDLSQNSTDWLDLSQNSADWIDLVAKAPAFGHGTMTAGLVHLVAPRAEIIPLKAFDASGSSSEWIIVRAILDAVDMGADVINMSFTSDKPSKLIADAVKYAASKGVVLVGATGNDNQENPTYPASLDEVVAVTSVSPKDVKSAFANYGKYVDLSAPGEHLITTFPKGFASVSGTSEAAPIVAGVFALAKSSGVRPSRLRATVEDAVDEVKTLDRYKSKLGSGRINASKAVRD